VSVIAALLDATPEPITGDADELIASFETMIAKRTAILTALDPSYKIPADELPLFEELTARQDAWMVALQDARSKVCEQRAATTKLRAYAK
jgi:hypothetical protein